MVRPRNENPTPAELEILQVIWAQGPRTVRQVREVLNKHRPRAYTSVMSLMNVMAEKRLLTAKKKGRALIYSARVGRSRTRSRILRDVLNRVFDDSAHTLVAQLLAQSKPDGQELDEIRRVIAEFERGRESDDSMG